MKIMVFDVGGTAIKYGMVNENFEFIFSDEMPTNAFYGGNGVMNSLEAKLDEFAGQFDAIGVSTAGQVTAEGVIIGGTGNIPNYRYSRVTETFEKKYNVPVAVDNDVNCAGIGEAHFGAGVGYENFLCLTYGTGVGGCIYQNGDAYRGSNSAAAEFGHMLIHAGGKECTCGKHGCYEAYASCRALTTTVSEKFGRYMSGREIFKPENLTNPIVVQALDEWENEIAHGLVSLCSIFNPALIVLGGGIMSEDLLISHLQEKVIERVEDSSKHVKIEKAKLGNKAGMLGAAYLVTQKINK